MDETVDDKQPTSVEMSGLLLRDDADEEEKSEVFHDAVADMCVSPLVLPPLSEEPQRQDKSNPFAAEMEERAKQEMKLIQKFDRKRINPVMECWFLIDTEWLMRWAKYVQGGTRDPPGPITNANLFKHDLTTLRSGLQPSMDYRYVVDIYSTEVPAAQRRDIILKAQVAARLEVSRMRKQLRKQFPHHQPEEGITKRFCCCCRIRREQFDCFFFWLYTCCFRLSPVYFDRTDNLAHRLSKEGGLDEEEQEGDEEEGDQAHLLGKPDLRPPRAKQVPTNDSP